MFQRILGKLAGNYNEKQLQKLRPTVTKINTLSDSLSDLTDAQIQAKTQEFKDRIAKGEIIDDLLPEAFAVVKQACMRLMGKPFTVKGEQVEWNMIPYDVQLLGGIILHK